MNLYRVEEVWQLALVYSVRMNTARSLDIPLSGEFDEQFGQMYDYLLLEENEKGLATLRINFSSDDYAKIERVAVIKENQFRGLGSKLMKGAEEWVLEKGYQKIIINSMNSASGFYEKLGYIRDDRIELEFGPDNKRQVRFEKNLTNIND